MLTITHTPTEGTTIDGTSKGDGTAPILKTAGWKWGRSITAWYIPHSRDRAPPPRPHRTHRRRPARRRIRRRNRHRHHPPRRHRRPPQPQRASDRPRRRPRSQGRTQGHRRRRRPRTPRPRLCRTARRRRTHQSGTSQRTTPPPRPRPRPHHRPRRDRSRRRRPLSRRIRPHRRPQHRSPLHPRSDPPPHRTTERRTTQHRTPPHQVGSGGTALRKVALRGPDRWTCRRSRRAGCWGWTHGIAGKTTLLRRMSREHRVAVLVATVSGVVGAGDRRRFGVVRPGDDHRVVVQSRRIWTASPLTWPPCLDSPRPPWRSSVGDRGRADPRYIIDRRCSGASAGTSGRCRRAVRPGGLPHREQPGTSAGPGGTPRGQSTAVPHRHGARTAATGGIRVRRAPGAGFRWAPACRTRDSSGATSPTFARTWAL